MSTVTPKIAIVEDQKIDSDSMRELLEAEFHGCEVHQFFDRKSAETGLLKVPFNLVIVDIDLGGIPPDKYGGFAILGLLTGKPVATLVVSGTPEENLKDVVLSLRAYDFVGKPFSTAQFLNATRHALQWKPLTPEQSNELVFSGSLPPGLTWDTERSPAFMWKGKSVRLTMSELRLVICLVKTAGRVVLTKTLVDLLDSGDSSKAVAVHINGIRQKFREFDPGFDQLESDPGKGYVWKIEIN